MMVKTIISSPPKMHPSAIPTVEANESPAPGVVVMQSWSLLDDIFNGHLGSKVNSLSTNSTADCDEVHSCMNSRRWSVE